jgi:crooked neck
MSRGFGVKNRAPASIQITAEQLLREAADRQIDGNSVAPKQQITDLEELTLFRQRKRKEFEDAIRMQRYVCTWRHAPSTELPS